MGGAFTFAQESLKRFFADHGEKGLAEGGEKKGVRTCPMIFDRTQLTTSHRHSYLRAHSVHFAAAHILPHMELVAHQCASLPKHLHAR